MNEDNSTRLAELWSNDHPQVIVIWPLVWKHYPNGNWFILRKMKNET